MWNILASDHSSRKSSLNRWFHCSKAIYIEQHVVYYFYHLLSHLINIFQGLMFNLSVPSMHLKYDLYCMWLWISKKHKLFFSSFSLHLMRNLHFEGSSLVALLACYVSLSPPNKISIQTITRRAVILSASGMSENLLLISHVKNGTALFVTFWHQLKWTPVRSYGSDWLGDDVIHITVWNTAAKNTVGDRKGTYRFDFGWFRPEAAL